MFFFVKLLSGKCNRRIGLIKVNMCWRWVFFFCRTLRQSSFSRPHPAGAKAAGHPAFRVWWFNSNVSLASGNILTGWRGHSDRRCYKEREQGITAISQTHWGIQFRGKLKWIWLHLITEKTSRGRFIMSKEGNTGGGALCDEQVVTRPHGPNLRCGWGG